jgi:hypothetical protein
VADTYQPVVDTGTVAAVRLAFQRQRSAGRNWKTRQHTGRVDGRSVWRNDARCDRDIFRDRTATGAIKVNVHILVDASGSMTSEADPNDPDVVQARADKKSIWMLPPEVQARIKTRVQAATDVTATLVEAFRTQQDVRLSVWMHNTWTHDNTNNVPADLSLIEVIKSGKGKENIPYMPLMAGGGNGDGYAIKHVVDRLARETRPDEVPLLIVVSDGLPSWISPDRAIDWNSNEPVSTQKSADGTALVFNVVNDARDRGVRVLSVAIAPNVNQAPMYGAENVIPFDVTEVGPAWGPLAVKFGAALGDTLARAAEAKAKHRRR